MNIHGISNEQAHAEGQDPAVAIAQIAQALTAAAVGGIPVIAFNASFDFTILERECRRHDCEFPRVVVIDPFVLDKKLDKWRKGPRTLTATCAHYNVRLDCAHDATQDALAAASIARRMAFLWPGELQIELPGLHNKQVLWHHEAAAEFQSYLQNKKGEADAFVQGDWPVQSLPTGWDPAARPRIQAGVAWLKELTAKKESNEGVREAERRIAAVNTANWLDLSHLALTDSDFWSLRPAICNLSALTNLDLSNNQLTALPQAIGNLTALTNLDLSNNQLTALPEAIGNLTALTKISLNDNQLTPLPPGHQQPQRPDNTPAVAQPADRPPPGHQQPHRPDLVADVGQPAGRDAPGDRQPHRPDNARVVG